MIDWNDGLSEEEQRLVDESQKRALAMGRPFTEREVLQPAWDEGYELAPAMFPWKLREEGHWIGKGKKRRYQYPLWVAE